MRVIFPTNEKEKIDFYLDTINDRVNNLINGIKDLIDVEDQIDGICECYSMPECTASLEDYIDCTVSSECINNEIIPDCEFYKKGYCRNNLRNVDEEEYDTCMSGKYIPRWVDGNIIHMEISNDKYEPKIITHKYADKLDDIYNKNQREYV